MDPVGKLVFATNYRPSIKDVGEAMWDRVHLVPFKVRIPDDEQDLHFGDKLFEQEASGILNWLLAGCLEWQQHGLQPPAEVVNATAEYREEQRPLNAFIYECADINLDQNTWKAFRENAGTVQEMYLRWHRSRQVKSSPLRGAAWTKALDLASKQRAEWSARAAAARPTPAVMNDFVRNQMGEMLRARLKMAVEQQGRRPAPAAAH